MVPGSRAKEDSAHEAILRGVNSGSSGADRPASGDDKAARTENASRKSRGDGPEVFLRVSVALCLGVRGSFRLTKSYAHRVTETLRHRDQAIDLQTFRLTRAKRPMYRSAFVSVGPPWPVDQQHHPFELE